MVRLGAAVGLVIWLTTALAGQNAETRTGTIRGVVVAPTGAARPAARPTLSSPGTAHEPVDRRTAVVYLDAAPTRAFDALPRTRARMDQRGEKFVPRVLAVTAGTTVDFPNNDLPFHNVMSLARANAFDLGRYPRGQSRAVRFDVPGIVPVICDIHAHMSAWILVFSHPFFVTTDAEGRFELPGIPAGTHVVRAWSELGTVEPRTVTVQAGATVDVDFRVGRAR
jgi:plastocyanin